MKIELIENTEFGFYNIKFGSRPDYEHNADMLNELKANGWAWSRHNGVWYPRTTDAKAKANTFAAEFAKKYNEPEKSFGQELFERTQRIDQWKKEHLPQEQNNEPVKEESKPVELNDNQKKVYDLLKATNNFSENQILEMVSKIDTAYQTENFNIPELSWEEIKSFIHADDSFDLAKDLRDLYNPNISETYNKINVVYNYLHDLMDFDVLGENQYERSADEEYHTMRESIRHDILQPVCENIVMDRYSDFFDMQEDFISRREEKIADISKSYMENPVIKEQYIGMKRAELLEKSPEMLKGREFNSWIFNINNDGHFLFYESNGYLKSEYLNDAKYNSVKDFLSQVEELDLLEESSKQLKEEYTKMHSLLEKPPVQIQDELIAKEVEEELANADERIDTSVSEYNDLGIDTRTGEPWNGEESEDVFEPEIQEEGSTELTQADLDNATKVIPEEQYQFMLENAAGEEAEYFKKKLKNMATICTDLQKHSNKENVNKDGSHPCKLHYFLGNCDWYISELDNDGIGFGYCILNGDLYNSEWGSVNVCGDSTYEQPLTKMSINVPIRINGSEFNRSVSPELDLHLDEDTTIERELYKLDNEYFADYKKYAEKDEKILAKSSEVSINIIEETNQELEVENGSKTDIGYERRTGISSGSNPNQGLEERGAYSDRGSDTGRGQRVLHSEREENGSLENSEGISELHTVGRESEISDLHIEEIQSGNNEVLHSERSLETGNSDLQQTGMENGQIPHRVRTIEPEHGTGVNPNENTSSEPLHGNEEVIEKETHTLTNGTQSFEMSFSNKDVEALKERYAEAKEDIKQNYVLEKLSAAGIEVVTDKAEFDKILESHNILQKMETSYTEEKNPLFQADEKELKAFAQKVDDWKAGNLASTEVISEFSTSTVLQAINIPANKVSVTQTVLEKMNAPENVFINKSHGHYLDIDTIKNIPNYLANPVMVFKSISRPDSYIIMTETVDSKNQTVMIALAVNKIEANIVVNNITSAYGREENEWFIEQIKEGNLVYQNKQKSLEWTNERGLLLPPQMSTQGSLNVIQKEDIVNKKTSNFSLNERYFAFTENQQKFFKECGFINSVGEDNEILDWKMEKKNPLTNKTVYVEHEVIRNGEYTVIPSYICYEDNKKTYIRHQYSNKHFYSKSEEQTFEEFLIGISFVDRENSFIVPSEKLGAIISEFEKNNISQVLQWSGTGEERTKFINVIDEASFKNKVSNLPAKYIAEDIYSSGIQPIGKVLQFVIHDTVAKAAGLQNPKQKHYLLEIQTDNNYEYIHNKDYPRLYEAKWDRNSQSYIDVVELDLSNFDSKIIGRIQYIAVNNCNYPNPPAQTMTLSDGKTYGFAYEGKIYLNPEIMNSEVAVHEYTHLWDNYIQRTNPKLWEKGKDIFQNTKFWEDVKADPNYADISDNDDLLLSEVHAKICGKMADVILNKIIERDGELTKDTVINWENEVDDYIYETFESERTLDDGRTIKAKGYGAFGTVVDINAIRTWFAQPMKDLMNSKNISISKEQVVSKEPDQLTSKKDIKAIREQCREILEKYDNTHLNEKEWKILNEMESENERHFVEESLRSTKYLLCTIRDENGYWDLEHGKEITANEARKMLGTSEFMSGLDRACFHWTSGRNTPDGKAYIHFDDSDRDRVVSPYEFTKEDLSILAQYEGAGGIKEDNRTVSGILNEFYTPNNLVEKVWQIVDAYAPNAKTVLEPSAGVGKFANNRPNNEFTMHELDETSARINKILHPEANVIQGAYQKQFFDAGERIHTPGQKSKYDVVIGNPPYGTYNDKYKGLGEGKEFDRYEEYFISKGLDALKDENSVMVFVVPSGFLNTASDKQKEIIAAKGRLIDAYRLPVGTFPTTEVGTDIIIMRTWEKDRKIIMENGKGNAAYKQASLDEAIELISDNISNGEWFKQHPEKILGEVKQKTNRFGKLEDVVVVHEGLTVQDELNKIDNFVEGINNSRKLRTYSVLNKDKINELTVVTQEEFNSIIDALYNQPSPDYKSIPSIIKLPQINQTLAQKLGVENANFFMRSEIAHVRPQRKGNYDQALRIDEMKGMLNFLKSCQTAYIDNDERHQNFILAGLDSQNSNKTNKIVFNKDENGNYIVTIGKVDSVEFNGGKYSRVAVGFEPTILRSKLEVWSPIATMLRSSTTPLDSTIPQQTEKSSQIIAPAPVQPEQTQSVSDKSETVAEEIDDPTKRLYEDPDGVFKTKHQLTREEFAKFYTGANFTQEDYNIWGATDWKGNVDTSKLTESELSYLKTSDNYVETNEGVYTNAMLYATGNIYQKLDELEENKENLSSESYEKAKAILTNAIPKVVPIENIKIDALSPLAQEFKVHREVTSSRWYMGRTELQTVELDIDLREDFINWATNCSSLDNFDENNQSINSRRSIYNYSSAKISREDIPEDISWTDIVNYIDRVPVPTHIDEKNDTKEVKNKKNLIAGNIKDARKNTCYELFNRYIQDGLQQEDKERLQSTWNRIYNATVHADYKKLPLFIDGMSTFKNNQPFMLYKQQVEGVSRLLSKGNGLLAYEVGVGKTAAGIVTTMGQLQTGRCKRPLIIVPNQVYKKWVNDFRELFPDVKINELYNLSEKYIDKHFDERTHSLLIEPGSVTVITDSALQKITFSDAVCSKELAEDFSYLLGVSDALHSGDDKEKAKAYQKIQNEIGKASRVQVKKLPEGREQRIQQSYIFFDECGFDNVVIDEAHRYKNLFTIPRPKRGDKGAREFEGLGTGKPSIRAEKVFGITTLIQRRNEDRNVFLLTATPFTNNPLEVYSMLSYMGRKELINRHIYDVRDFCTEFAQTKFEYSVKPTGDIEPKQVMKNFRGQKKLKNLVFEYIDAVSAKEAGIERPEGERHPIYLELSTLQQKIIKLEQDAIAASDDPSVTLKAMTTMRTCTLSPALLEPDDFASVEDIVIPPKSQIVESSPKLSWVCNTVADLYKQKPECGQFIYMPQGKDCFDEVKKYLIKQGIPDDAIDYIHSTHNGSAEDKDKISARFNNKEDKLKILIGTATVAEGIDLNGNSIVEYNTMLGWNPTESIQVEGRIWRQGNEQGKVHIMYPLMENSIDALIYQKHDEKASRINSVLSKTDDGKDAIDTDEINPETIKFELITDPTKKVKMIIDEKTAEKRKEIKVIDNRLETIQELEEDRQNSKTLYDTNVEEKEKYKSLLKTAREELKADPNNWQKEARVTSNERAVDTCNKEIAKARKRLNTISYNFNKFDIHEPEREVPIKLQELVTKKAELEADITDIENSKDRLIEEEQKKLLEKKILSKPVEELRKEWVEYVNKNTWYKKHNDKTKDRKETVQVPLEAVKDFKVPDEMIKKFDKAMAEMDFKVLHNYLNWGDRDIINDCHENDKAIVILRERYEKTKGVKLPEQFRKTTEYLVSVCDEKTLPEVCKFKSMEEAVACACSSWHGEAYQRDGYVEYVTLDNFKRNRDVSVLANDLQKREGQSYYGHGSPNGFGYDCSPKGVKIEAFINKKRKEFFVNWNQVAKIKAKQWNREYPTEFTIKDEPKREGEEKLKNIQMVQQDLFDFDEVKVQTKTLDIRMQGYNSQFILSDQALENYRGLPPFIKKSDNEWVIRCKGEDFAKPQEGIASYELVDISLTKEQLQGMVKAHLFAQQQEISHKKFDDPEYKGKVICPKSEVSDMQKELLKSNGISDNDLKKVTKENFNELLCDGEKPILKKKLPQPKQLKQENNQKLLPSTTIEIAEDTDFDYVY